MKRIEATIVISYEPDSKISKKRLLDVEKRINEVFDKQSPSTLDDWHEEIEISVVLKQVKKEK